MDVAATKATLGKDEFLRLFTTQLKFQNPLNPMDATQFTAQLAQFSAVEQLFTMNAEMSRLVGLQSSMNNGMAASFIGRRVVADNGASGIVRGIGFGPTGALLKLDSGQELTLGSIREMYEI